MRTLLNRVSAGALAAALGVLLLSPLAYAATSDSDSDKAEAADQAPGAEEKEAEEPSGKPETEAKPDQAGEPADKPEAEAKPDEGDAKDESEDIAEAAGVDAKGGIRMQELLGEGFLIRTTVLIPSDVVTRQLGKISADAVMVTLQKESAIAVCYYTLKAYVRLRLAEIKTCRSFR